MRTIEEIRALVERFAVGFPFAAWGARFEAADRGAWMTELYLVVPRAPHRDSGEPGPIRLSHIVDLNTEGWQSEVGFILEKLIREYATHEALESLKFDGVRPRDPHKDEAKKQEAA